MSEVERLIVIGASAGGLDAVSNLLERLDPSMPIACVVAFHLSAQHASMMGPILARRTSLAVETVQEPTVLRPGTVYVLDAGHHLIVDETRALARPVEPTHPPSAVDALFKSAAQAWGAKAIGVVMSGTGRDGRAGASALCAAGADVLCQSPVEAKFAGMPSAVVESELATFVGTCSEIAGRIADSLQLGAGGEHGDVPRDDAPSFWRLLSELRPQMEVDLFSYRIPTLYRRIAQRAQTLGSASVPAYVEFALAQEDERRQLARRILVGTTEFFRDQGLFETIRLTVVPMVAERETVRVWSAGCSTGEEAYSVAALLDHELRNAGSKAQLRVFATDVRRDILATAAAGRYSDAQLQSFPNELRGASFEPVDNSWQVREGLRKKVLFTVHDILRDPPFSNIDLALFRNVLIYLRPAAATHAVGRLHFALREGGLLALGSGESAEALGDGFASLAQARIPLARKVGPSRPQSFTFRRNTPRDGVRAAKETLGALATRAFMTLAGPRAVVVDAAGDVVHVLKDPAPYLRLRSGPMSSRAESMAHGRMRGVVAAALARLRRTSEPASLLSGPLDGLDPVRVRALPLGDGRGHALLLLEAVVGEAAGSEDLTSLHEELADARSNLEESLLELRTANEELESTNEEMLATNEELEATNEELQATNEELFSVNAERDARIAELTALRDDVEAMFVEARIAGMFLDANLRITRVVGDVSALVPITEADIGRSLAIFRPYVAALDLVADARRVLETQVPLTRQLRTEGGGRFQLKVHPVAPRATSARVMLLFADESKLELARAKTERIIDALPQSLAVLDERGLITFTNRRWRNFGEDNGWRGETWSGVDYLSSIDPADPTSAEARELLQAVFAGTTSQGQLAYPCHGNGIQRWFAMDVAAIEGGGVLVSHRDDTAAAQTRHHLEEEKRRLLDVLDRMPSGPVLVDSDETIVHVSAAASRILGRAPEDVEGTNLRLLMTAGSQPTLDRSPARGRELKLELLRADGTRVPARYTPREAGLGVVLLGGASDRQRLSMDTMTTLTGGIAHELNNAMAPLAAFVESWAADERIPEDMRAQLEEARTAFAHGKSVTSNLLRFARKSDAGRGVASVDDVSEHVVSLVRTGAPRGVRVSVDGRSDAHVPANASELSHALLNLVLNAVEACGVEGWVRVEAEVTQDAERPVRIRVHDNGVGMEPSIAERIFDPFFTTKEHMGGTGLGLALVRKCVLSVGGTIACDSSPGAGTTFELAFPRAEAPTTTARPTTSEGLLQDRHGLVVDDDPAVRHAIKRLLETCGARIDAVPSGEAALERLAEHDFVVLDVMMPGLSGPQTLKTLRERGSDVPVVLLTGDPARIPDDEEETAQTRFVLKPANRQELLTALAEAGVGRRP